MKSLGYLKWDLYARANDSVFNRYCHKFVGCGFEVFVEAAILLRKNDGNPIDLAGSIEEISIVTGISQDSVEKALVSAINDYNLFKLTEDDKFYSNRIRRDVQESLEISKVRSQAGKNKGSKKSNDEQMKSNDEQKPTRKELRDNSNKKDNSSTNVAELQKEKNSSNSPYVVLKDGQKYELSEDYIQSKQKAFPTVDVLAELWKLQAKTLGFNEYRLEIGKIDGYINRWLQNAANDKKTATQQNSKGRQMMATNEEYKEIAKEWNGKC